MYDICRWILGRRILYPGISIFDNHRHGVAGGTRKKKGRSTSSVHSSRRCRCLRVVLGATDKRRREWRRKSATRQARSFGGNGFRGGTHGVSHPSSPIYPIPRGLTFGTPAAGTKHAFVPVGRCTYSALCLYLAASSSRRALVESCRSHFSRAATPAVRRLAIPSPHPVRLSSTQMRRLARTKNRCKIPTPAAGATKGADASLPKGPKAERFGDGDGDDGDGEETARCVQQDSKTWIQHPRICELSFPVVASESVDRK
jgi:hypothetical protein